jgi:hypothetical protein
MALAERSNDALWLDCYIGLVNAICNAISLLLDLQYVQTVVHTNSTAISEMNHYY